MPFPQPLGQLQLEDPDFVQMTRVIRQWANEACNGRVVSCMEGGYDEGDAGINTGAASFDQLPDACAGLDFGGESGRGDTGDLGEDRWWFAIQHRNGRPGL